MDADRFDGLVACLGTRRRAVLGAVAAGVLARLGYAAEEAAAGPVCRRTGDPCRQDAQCCTATCKKRRGKKKGRCRCAAGDATCAAGSPVDCCPPDLPQCCPAGTGGGIGCCDDGDTCCPTGSGDLGCCTAANPVCCASTDAAKCCPTGQTCCPAGSANNCNSGAGCN